MNANSQNNRGVGIHGLPPWMQAEKISWSERMEISAYKVISYIPVAVTVGLFSFLFLYYTYCFLYPSLMGDFYNILGLADMWENQAQLDADRTIAKFYTAIFIFFSINLFVSIVLTITTSPGYIPDDSEWDMPSETSEYGNNEINENAGNNQQAAQRLSSDLDQPRESNLSAAVFNNTNKLNKSRQEEFTNTEIQEDAEDPREPGHYDYKYIKSKAGPLFKQEDGIDGEIQPLVEEKEQHNRQKNIQKFSFERKKFGGIRMCQRCLRTKPDRCHHCSQCNMCILKMDHHCPWVANCIGFFNYKYFLNMIMYASLSCIMIVMTSYPVLGAVLSREGIEYKLAYFIVTAYVLACVFGFIITGFFCFHLWLISNQYTTIEFCEKRGSDSQFKVKSPYNRGIFQNFQSILGTNTLLWFLPMRRNLRGQGLFFEVRDDLRQAGDLQNDTSRNQQLLH